MSIQLQLHYKPQARSFKTHSNNCFVALEYVIHALYQKEHAVALIPFANISSRKGENKNRYVSLSAMIKMINCLCGSGEPGEDTVRTKKKCFGKSCQTQTMICCTIISQLHAQSWQAQEFSTNSDLLLLFVLKL